VFLTPLRAALAVATLGLVVGGTGVAVGQTGSDHAHHGGYDHGGRPNDIPNLGLVKNDIKAYYGDDGTTDHNATGDSQYAADVRRVERKAYTALPTLIKKADAAPVVLVDVDDTTLLTYRYEATHDFGYDPTVNAAYIHDPGMPQVFGMPDLLTTASRRHAEVYYLTGRPESQRADTERDLTKAGYPDVDSDHLFMRDKANPPAYLQSCDKPPSGPYCTTVQYKSQTREHIETLNGGQDIVANFGDQFSDLSGGFADARYKMPNPMYFLP
jgi:predicted secreted acid phosphatase